MLSPWHTFIVALLLIIREIGAQQRHLNCHVRLLGAHLCSLVLIFYCWLNHMVIFLYLIHPHPFVLLPSPFSPVPLFLALCVLLLFGWFYFGRVARRPPSSTVDGGVLSRLLTPTQASLARSKSAATLSADGKDAPGNLGVEEPDRGGIPKKICSKVFIFVMSSHCCEPNCTKQSFAVDPPAFGSLI